MVWTLTTNYLIIFIGYNWIIMGNNESLIEENNLKIYSVSDLHTDW